ncbi:uncharacterized protein DS421_11g337640 [Arachis hypogaea]|nr:uncharacterized protein DS421_20g704260 [Arachis hypogaea]QHN83378.1 uncharacterized protein DS421_20g704270 [Arachis hypogaea]QHO20142.1 uncharacterized protein DS421_11g335290 [Arachis hypogaea]QHO20400.1 uncharacterized protein DS421_11g337630 [Arachis hypogaea]QHO20401.1 uncharacterized protein DS421_11g337640 [Arachis hypogaea]
MNPLRFWCSGSPPLPPESLAAAPTVAPFGFWVSAPPLPLEAAAWPLLPCRQNLPPWPPELRAEFLPLETLLPPCSTAVTVTGVFARDCHLGLLTEPLPGVRIRFAYATCSGFCFRESKPSRVLIVGDFGQSEKSSVDTLGLSFAC